MFRARDGEPKPEGPEGFHGPANISPDGKSRRWPISRALSISTSATPPTRSSSASLPSALRSPRSSRPALAHGYPLWNKEFAVCELAAIAERCNAALNSQDSMDNRNTAQPRAHVIYSLCRSRPAAPPTKILRKAVASRQHNIDHGDQSFPTSRNYRQPDLSDLFQCGAAGL